MCKISGDFERLLIVIVNIKNGSGYWQEIWADAHKMRESL